VQTFILSKRWRGLWVYTPSIFINCNEFRARDGINQEKITCFVNSFFILWKISHMDSFRLHWIDPYPVVRRTWIHRVAECKPRLVQLDLYGCDVLELPQSLFTCTSIEVMKLTLSAWMKRTTIQPKSVFLPCLRSLTLPCAKLGNDFMKKLAWGCPVLEEMVIANCRLDMTDISSPYLRSLVIEYCQVEHEVCISMPSLVSLKIEEVVSGMIWLRNMSSLLKASLSL
jgi:hypothetical protein